MAGGLLVAAGLALFAAPWASREPDGLERVARDQGFADRSRGHDLKDGPLAGYSVTGLAERRGTAVAGLVGVLVTFGATLAVFSLLRHRRRRGRPGRTPAGTEP
ncbi:MAG: PDGLE domain-containing protein [Candidatus Rokuibacteriota bacterium]